MPSPSNSLATLRPDLAGSVEAFDMMADAGGFIGTRVAPVLEVMEQAGKFGKIPLAELLKNRSTDRAPGAAYSRDNMQFQDASFACAEHGQEEPVDDREARMYANYFNAEVIAARRAVRTVLENHEKRVADLIFNATTFSGQTTAIATDWHNNATTATPVNDIEAAVQAAYGKSGLWPNALVINRKTFRRLRMVDQIRDRISSNGAGSSESAGLITVQQIAQVFDLDFVLVAGGTKNSANEGATAAATQIWSDDMAMVCRVATSDDIREPCLARTFHWGEDGSQIGTQLESYRDETVRSDIVRARMDTDELLITSECGHLLTGVAT